MGVEGEGMATPGAGGSASRLLALPGSAFGLVVGFLDADDEQALRASCRVFALILAHLMRAASAGYDVHDADEFLRRPTVAVVHPWVAVSKRYASLSPYSVVEWEILVQLAFLRGKLSTLLLYRNTDQIGSMVVDSLCMRLLPTEFSELIARSSLACIAALNISENLAEMARSCQRQVFLGSSGSSVGDEDVEDMEDDEEIRAARGDAEDDIDDDLEEDMDHSELKNEATDDIMEEDTSSVGDWRAVDDSKRLNSSGSGDATSTSTPRTNSRSDDEEMPARANGRRGVSNSDDGDVEMMTASSNASFQEKPSSSTSSSPPAPGPPANTISSSSSSESSTRNCGVRQQLHQHQNTAGVPQKTKITSPNRRQHQNSFRNGVASNSESSNANNNTHGGPIKNSLSKSSSDSNITSTNSFNQSEGAKTESSTTPSKSDNFHDQSDEEKVHASSSSSTRIDDQLIDQDYFGSELNDVVAERMAILKGSSRSEDFYHQKQDALNGIVNLVENQFAYCSRVLRFPLWNAACNVATASGNSLLTSDRVASLYTNGFCIIDNFLTEGTVRAVFQRCVDFVKMTNSVLNLPADELEKLGLPEPSSFFMMRGDPPTARGDCLLWLNREAPPGSKPPFSGVMDRFTQLYEELGSVIKLQGGREAQLAFYPDQGEGYRRHRDSTPDDGSRVSDNRRITAICYCNPSWDESHGGKLRLWLSHLPSEPVIDLRPLPGRLVVFLSGLLDHEVRPSFHGRVAVTNWFW